MQKYVREDGTECLAERFEGYVYGGADKLFELSKLLHVPGFHAGWHPQESTDTWEYDEEGEPYEVIIPEHIKTVNDMLKVGDYVIQREDDTYIMDGHLFEAIWSLATAEDH